MNSIENWLQRQVNEKKTPSAHYIRFNHEQIFVDLSTGYADVLHETPVTPATTYHGYSVTKTFTAVAILQLAEKGRLLLDAPVKTYWAGFPYPDSITVRHLLTHTAGIPNPIPLSWIHLAADHDRFEDNIFFADVLRKHSKLKSAPNEKFTYTNLGYILLGQLIEHITDSSYEQYIRTHMLQPIGLGPDDIGFTIPMMQDHAKGYHKKMSWSNLALGLFIDKAKYMGPSEGAWKPFVPFYVNGTAYGGLVGKPMAFARYVQALLHPESPLLSKPSIDMMWTENHSANGKPTGMCLSWFTSEHEGKRFCAHAGGGGGYYGEIRVYPDEGMGSVIFFNRTGMTDERILNQVDNL